jgi:hypothetical protein
MVAGHFYQLGDESIQGWQRCTVMTTAQVCGDSGSTSTLTMECNHVRRWWPC